MIKLSEIQLVEPWQISELRQLLIDGELFNPVLLDKTFAERNK